MRFISAPQFERLLDEHSLARQTRGTRIELAKVWLVKLALVAADQELRKSRSKRRFRYVRKKYVPLCRRSGLLYVWNEETLK